MEMEQVIARLNVLAKKAKAEPLSEAEQKEREQLRRIYIDAVKASLTGQLENTYVVEKDGTRRKLTRRK